MAVQELESCYRLLRLLFTLAGILYWQTLQQGDENEEIDIWYLPMICR